MDFEGFTRLGEPDLIVCGLRLWILGREFPAATDYWDGNWLRATAYCIYPHSMVRVLNDACIRVDELTSLMRGCEQMYASLSGEAALQCMEPCLSLELAASTNGHIDVKLSISP